MTNAMRKMRIDEMHGDADRDELLRIILRRSFALGKFTLASGKVSDYYLDLKPTMFDPHGSRLLAQMVLQRLWSVNIDCVGGLEMGAVPLVTTVAMLSDLTHRPIPGFFVRKSIKDHGTKRKIEGTSEPIAGKRVAILDDVTTTGESAMLAVLAAQEAEATVALVLSVVDRQEGAVEFYKGQNIPFAYLFTASEFMAA
jgi:orotate phosphoribosyltransferase